MQEKLMLLREKNNMTSKELAELLNITPIQYRKKEKGIVQFKLNEMLIISEHFNMSMDDIFLPSKHQNGATLDEEREG